MRKVCGARHDLVVVQAKRWKGGIVRVRVELPAAAMTERPQQDVTSVGKTL
jgi:hypothetical protein